MVISVPHTGTRTLRDHLGFNGYWHFGQNDPDIKLYTGMAHIPIRDPFDVSVSWQARYPTDQSHAPGEELRRWELLMAYVKHRPHTVFHKIEDLAIKVGEGPKHWARDKKRRKDALELDRIILLRKWIQQAEPSEFFGRFYRDFWWV